MSTGVAALRELEGRRRARRVEQSDLLDLLFRAYVYALIVGVGLWAMSRVLGGPELDDDGLARLTQHGPGTLGALLGAALHLGARTGRRGGPLTVDHASVRHVLLAPIPRATALRGPMLVQLRFALFVGVTIGGATGVFAGQRLPGALLAWVGAGAATGALLALAWAAVGLCVAGWRLGWSATVATGVLFAWAGASLMSGRVLDPLSAVGGVALAPLPGGPTPVAAPGLVAVGVILLVVVLAAGLTGAARASIEVIERRGRLVSLLRFSVTNRDLRAVVLFRRRLAGEVYRSRPWLMLDGPNRWPVWRRGWRGAMRWPTVRWLRVAGLGIVVAYATAGAAWARPLVAVAAAAQFTLAVEATEALAEDADHPTLRTSVPVDAPALWLRHLWAGSVVVAGAGLIGIAALVPVVGTQALGAVTVVVPAAVLACATAGWVAIREPLSPEVLLMDVQGAVQGLHVFGPVVVGGFGPTLVGLSLAAPDRAGPVWPATAIVVTVVAAVSVVWLATRGRARTGR